MSGYKSTIIDTESYCGDFKIYLMIFHEGKPNPFEGFLNIGCTPEELPETIRNFHKLQQGIIELQNDDFDYDVDSCLELCRSIFPNSNPRREALV